MKISLARRGGWGAGVNLRLPPKTVDTDELPGASADELKRLVAAARAEPAVRKHGAEPGRDAMTYVITIENGDGPLVLSQSDPEITLAFLALRDWLRNYGK